MAITFTKDSRTDQKTMTDLETVGQVRVPLGVRRHQSEARAAREMNTIIFCFWFFVLFCFVLFRNGRVHILLFSEPAVSASESRVRFREFPPLDHRSGGDGWLEHLRVAARNRDVTATPAPAAAAAPTTTTRRWWKTRRSSAFRSCSGGFCRPVVGFQVRASPVAKT